ncbi:unnamed protein product [Prunus armeniaca]
MAGSGGGELRAPIFNGIESSDSKGADESDVKKKEKEESSGAGKMVITEIIMKYVKALGLIQGAVSDEIFPRISHEETSQGAWNILKQEFHGDKQVVASLKSFAQRLERHHENKTEKAFASLSVDSKSAKVTGNQDNKQHKNWKDKGRKWDNKPTDGAKKSLQALCKKPMQHVNYATQVTKTPTMFYPSKVSASMEGSVDVWYLDSGCSNHMTGKEDLLVDIDKTVIAKVAMGTGQLVDVTRKGSIVVETKEGRRYIKEVMLVPGLKENLLSVGQMIEHGYHLVFGNQKAEIYDDSSYSNLVAKVPMIGNRSFPLKLEAEMHIAYKENVCQSSIIWHRRLGHVNMDSLQLMQKQDMVIGLPEITSKKGVCEGCVLGKQCREAFPKETTTKASTPLELIHSDVCGPMQTTTKAGNCYFLTFIDDCTRMCWVYFLRHKSDVFHVSKKFKATVELQSGYKVKKLRSDRGGEYTSNEFNRFCDEMGMERQLIMAYSP